MIWEHQPGMSFADCGAAVIHGDDGWEAYPFGVESGSSGCHATRDDAIAAAEQVAASALCCSVEPSQDAP